MSMEDGFFHIEAEGGTDLFTTDMYIDMYSIRDKPKDSIIAKVQENKEKLDAKPQSKKENMKVEEMNYHL